MVAEGLSDIPTDWLVLIPITALIAVMLIGGVVGTVYFVARPSAGRVEPEALG